MGALAQLADEGEAVRNGVQRRLTETRGVITTEDARLNVRLLLNERPLPTSQKLLDALALARSGTRPDPDMLGDRLEDQIEIVNCCRQLALGFFSRWKFPRGEPLELIDEWFAKRKAWNAELRQKLERRSSWMDSPGLLREAAERSLAGYKGDLPVWHAGTFAAWQEIEEQVQPEEDPVWLDDVVVKDAIEWGRTTPGGIIWYAHVPFGQRVAELGGFHLYEGGDEASAGIRMETGKRTIVASIKAHGEGKNLHAFNKSLVTSWPASNKGVEQLVARTHRYRQRAAEVSYETYLGTDENKAAFDSSVADARYGLEVWGLAQRLLFCEGGLAPGQRP
jgi:hypothetical protein